MVRVFEVGFVATGATAEVPALRRETELLLVTAELAAVGEVRVAGTAAEVGVAVFAAGAGEALSGRRPGGVVEVGAVALAEVFTAGFVVVLAAALVLVVGFLGVLAAAAG